MGKIWKIDWKIRHISYLLVFSSKYGIFHMEAITLFRFSEHLPSLTEKFWEYATEFQRWSEPLLPLHSPRGDRPGEHESSHQRSVVDAKCVSDAIWTWLVHHFFLAPPSWQNALLQHDWSIVNWGEEDNKKPWNKRNKQGNISFAPQIQIESCSTNLFICLFNIDICRW